MTPQQYKIFSDFRMAFKKKIEEWSVYNDRLRELQIQASQNGGTPDYPVQNPVCYNTALDLITEEDEINIILIGDNPGKNEQLDENKKYLVGLAGKLGVKFFAEHPELNTDFRKNVIILNKTPVHSARTEHLKYIIKNGGPKIETLISESQEWMARETARLHMALQTPQLWLVGYAELKGKGLFLKYRDTLIETYKNQGKLDFCKDNVFTFQHFSMNRFTIDLNDYIQNLPDQEKKNALSSSITDSLFELGSLHRKEIFGV